MSPSAEFTEKELNGEGFGWRVLDEFLDAILLCEEICVPSKYQIARGWRPLPLGWRVA